MHVGDVVFDAVYVTTLVTSSLQRCWAEPGDEAATTTTPTTVMSLLHSTLLQRGSTLPQYSYNNNNNRLRAADVRPFLYSFGKIVYVTILSYDLPKINNRIFFSKLVKRSYWLDVFHRNSDKRL